MPISARPWLVPILFLAVSGMAGRAQDLFEERPAPLKTKLLSRQESAKQEALRLYALSVLQGKRNEILEAIRTLEQANKLDPSSATLARALIPLYLAAQQADDALEACRKTVERDPGDFEIWYLYASQLKDRGKPKEAIEALVHAVGCLGIKERRNLVVQMHFDLGVLYEETGNADRAEVAYREVVKALGEILTNLERPEVLPEFADNRREEIEARIIEAYERILRVCLKAQHYERAVAAFQDAPPSLLARTGRLNYQLAQAYRGKGDLREARHRVEEYLQTQPATTEAYELHMAILKEMGQEDDILPSLKKYAQRDAHNVSLQLLLARQYETSGQTGMAESLYKGLAEESPSPDVYRGLFQLYRKSSRMGDALAMFDKAVEDASEKDNNHPGDPGAAARARAMLAVFRDEPALAKELVPAAVSPGQSLHVKTRQFVALIAGRTHQLEPAEKLYRDCLDVHASPEIEAELYSGLIQVLWEANKREAVVEVCRKGLKESQATNRILFHRTLARALAFLGKGDEAVAQADEAVKLAEEPQRLTCRLLRVQVLSILDRSADAVAECQALLKETNQAEGIRDIRYTMSSIYSSAHELAKSEEQLRLILQDNPNDASACNDLGYIMADQNKSLPEAEELIRKAIKLDRDEKKTAKTLGADDDRDHAAYIDSLGWVLFRRGQTEAAREQLEKAVGLPDGAEDPTVWDHLGDVCFRANDMARAREAWEKSVKFYESDRRRKRDDQYKEVKHKLGLVETLEEEEKSGNP